jgi:hypothetical protein
MSLEDRIRSSVDQALDDLRHRVEADMHSLVDQLVTAAAQEREEAVRVASRAAFDEAWQTAERDAAVASARALAATEQRVADVRAEEQTNADRRMEEMAAAIEARIREAQQRAEAQAAIDAHAVRVDTERRLRDHEHAHSRLLEAMRSLDRAETLTEVLDALATAISRETSRVGVFVVRHDRLVGWRFAGFGSRDTQPKSVDIGLKDGGLLADAVHEARPIAMTPGDMTTGSLAFADIPSDGPGVAIPVIVGGRVVAVVYSAVAGTTPAASVPSGWQERVEIMTRYGARCLEALTVQRTPVSTPPRFWVPSPAPQPAAAAADTEAPAPVAAAAGTPA